MEYLEGILSLNFSGAYQKPLDDYLSKHSKYNDIRKQHNFYNNTKQALHFGTFFALNTFLKKL